MSLRTFPARFQTAFTRTLTPRSGVDWRAPDGHGHSLRAAAFASLLLSPLANAQTQWGFSDGSTLTQVEPIPLNLSSFNIVISPGSLLAANSAALAAFERAAASWESLISDPITVTINANFGTFASSSTIGSTSSTTWSKSFAEVRNAMVADSAGEADDAIVSKLPVFNTFSALIPSGSSLSGNMWASQANLKALGFTGFSSPDATITFNTAFPFDYDNSSAGGGVGTGLMDFETVATHEIGHALGFISIVDQVNAGQTSISPMPLDLFRFRDGVAGSDPSSESEFTTFKRDLVPGSGSISIDAIFDDLGIEHKMSAGLTGSYVGTDGRQASHWKDDLGIGLMDPTLAYGVSYTPSLADFRALDLIGYDINFSPVPEISAVSVGFLLLLGAGRRRRTPQGAGPSGA